MNKEWIEHRGGARPVSNTQEVFVRFRDGHETPEPSSAGAFDWTHMTHGSDIVAYRLADFQYTREDANLLYLEAEARIWKMKNYFIRSVALNFILLASLVALWWIK